LRETVYPLLFGFRIVPKVAFVPLFMVWFGTGLVMKSAITAMAIFFIFLVQALLGFASVEPELVELGRSYRMSTWNILWRLRFPAALPSLMVGLKLGVTYALVMVIVAEMVVANRGLGAVVVESSARLRTAETMAVILVVSVGGVLLYGLGNWVDRKLTRWYYE
jgi:NitT/TauT family transport system permease protein